MMKVGVNDSELIVFEAPTKVKLYVIERATFCGCDIVYLYLKISVHVCPSWRTQLDYW